VLVLILKKNTKKTETPIRFDFVQKVESYEKTPDGLLVTFSMILDPKRYETIEVNGKKAYKDKNTGEIIPEKVLESALSKVSPDNPLPIYSSPPKRNDPCNYLLEKKKEIEKNWNGQDTTLNNGSNSIDTLLTQLAGKDILFSIMYVDLKDSTELSYNQTPEINEKIIKIFINQMIQIIDLYNGFVLKVLGDCVIGIFPSEPNAPNACDNIFLAAIMMRNIIEDVINPIFLSKNYPIIGYHIGMDLGRVKITNIGATDIAKFLDVIGYPMNLTSKIQAQAGHNEILIGRQLFSMIHCQWQKHCNIKKLDDSWKLRDPQNQHKIYELYSIDTKWNCKDEI